MKYYCLFILIIVSFNWSLAQDKPKTAIDSLKKVSQKTKDSTALKVKIVSDSLKQKLKTEEKKEIQLLKIERNKFFTPETATFQEIAPPPPPQATMKELKIYQEQETELILESYSQQLQEKSVIVDEDFEISYSVIMDPDNETFFSKTRLKGPSSYDSRVEVRILNPDVDWQRKVLEKNQSVAIVVEKEKLSAINQQFYQIDISTTLGDFYNLCTTVPFKNQPVIGVGTAFITGKDEMTTAKHVFQRKLENYVIVFGYELLIVNGLMTFIGLLAIKKRENK